MSQQQNCCDTVAFDSWRLYSMALKICYSHAPKAYCFSVMFSSLANFSCVFVLQSNGFVTRQGVFLSALEGEPSALNSWRSGFRVSLWRSFWPLFGIKFQCFMIHGILLFPPAIYWVILGKLPSLEILQVFGRFLLYGRETV